MEYKTKKAAGGCPATNTKIHLKPNKIKPFPQEPIAWAAFKESIKRTESDPSPANRFISNVMASHWREIAQREVFNG